MNALDSIARIVDLIRQSDLNVEMRFDEPLRHHTSFKIGGPVRVMLFPADTGCTIKLCEIFRGCGTAPHILGKGSNILASDSPLDIAVINMTGLCSIELPDGTDGTVIRADSGVTLAKLADFACKHSLSGLEFAHGIPGTLGGAVVMNAGAYGGEMRDVTGMTTAFSMKSGVYTLLDVWHELSYRNSYFAKNGDVVLVSSLHLEKGDRQTIRRTMAELAALRRQSQPLDFASAGSTFKRPEGAYAAALIEQVGLKGHMIGGAQVSGKHSGFIINRGDATFADVMALIEYVQQTVEERSGIKLELEVKVWK